MTEPSVAPADQLDASARRTPEFMRDFMDAGLGPSTDGLERRQRRLSVQVGALARGDYRGIIDPASAPDGSDDQVSVTWAFFVTVPPCESSVFQRMSSAQCVLAHSRSRLRGPCLDC